MRFELTGREYNAIMVVAPVFLIVALFLMIGVTRGEAVQGVAAPAAD